MEKNLIKVDFLQGALGKKKNYSLLLHVFIMAMIVLNMSFMGVFFVAQTIQACEWDKSSLEFTDAAGDCEEITATVCNTGDKDMQGTTDYEVWYDESGDPKNGTKLTQGDIGPLSGGDCQILTYDPSDNPSGADGSYKFKAYQRPGHPGSGELWSDTIVLEDCDNNGGPVCGNGFIEDDEVCDDGGDNGQVCEAGYGETCEYCSNVCTLIELSGPYCGDGVLQDQYGEECDDGPEGSDTCTTECKTICCQPDKVTIKAFKIVCEDEADLPNWGTGGPDITADTATNYVNDSQGKCYLASGWSFQWGFDDKYGQDGVNKLNGAHINEADGSGGDGTNTGTGYNDWKTFNSSTGAGNEPAQVQISDLEGAGALWVRENLQAGYIPFTNPPQGLTDDDVSAELYCHTDAHNYDNNDLIINLALGETYYCVGFNAPQEGECDYDIDGYKYNDYTKAVLANWEIELKDSSGTLLATTTTDENGYYIFDNLCTSDYQVQEILPLGWSQLAPINPAYYEVSLPDCGCASYDFCNQPLICGYKYDFDTQAGLANWHIFLKQWQECAGEWQTVDETLTDENGLYCFATDAGDYRIEEEVRLGWTYHDYYFKDISFSGQEPVWVDFYNEKDENGPEYGSIKVCKYEDADGLASTTGDRLLATSVWTFNLNDGTTTTVQDTIDGCTVFTGLNVGEYNIAEELLNGWIVLEPAGGTTTVNLSQGENKTIDFVNYYPALEYGTIEVCKYEDADGLASTTGDRQLTTAVWTFNLSLGTTTTAQDTTNGCTIFSGLDSGDYTITENLLSYWFVLEPIGGLATTTLGQSEDQTIDFVNYYEGPKPFCGDGIVNPGEECDDGNNTSGDGCSATCQIEHGGGGGFFTYQGRSGPPPSEPEEVLGEEGVPVLTINKTIGVEFANPGDTDIEYTITIGNTGNLTAFSVTLTDILPTGLTYTESGSTTQAWELGDFAPGIEKIVKYLVNVDKDAVAMIYTNTAEVKAANHDPVSTTADLDVREVKVLPITGFSVREFIALIGIIVALLVAGIIIKKNYLTEKR